MQIFLHSVNDSKVVHRISSRYAGLPKVLLVATEKDPETGKRRKIEVETSEAHKSFRMDMGHNDQSDGKRSLIGLSSKYFKRWPQKMVAKIIEDAIVYAHNNYLLDPNCPIETWPVFLYKCVQELLDAGENMRTYKVTKSSEIRRSRAKALSKKPTAGSAETLAIGLKCPGRLSFPCLKEIPFGSRTKQCAFCGRQKAKHKCRACHMTLCVTKPKGNYRQNGPCCFLRFHGYNNFTN